MSDDSPKDGPDAALIERAKSAPVVDFLNRTLKDALAGGVETIELAVQAAQSTIRFERGGSWTPRPAPDRDLAIGLAARLKILGNIYPTEVGDGAFELKVQGKAYRFDVRAASGAAGEILTVIISQVS